MTPLVLRPYQVAAIQAMRMALGSGARRIICCSPTGSGKTELGIAMSRAALAKGKRIAFLCNRIHLVEQAVKRFARAGIDCGVIQGDNTRMIHLPIVVASIQTVAKRGLPDVDLLLIDEAHAVAGSKDYRNLLIQRNNVPVIGLSATPFAKGLGRHYDELGGGLFQSMVVAATIPELITDGYLVDCDIYAPGEPDMSAVRTQKNAFGELDFSDKDAAEAADKPQLIGDIVEHWFRLAAWTPTVCFASNIAHSKHIVAAFRAAGVPAEHIDCYTSEDDRAAIMARVSSGKTTVISNVGILTEGWDFPACKTLILARPTRSLIRYIQMAGRVLRPHWDKPRALILDHSGTVSRLGFPTDDLALELDDGKPKEGHGKQEEALPKCCASCKFMKPPRTRICPQCGFAPEVQNVVTEADGELVRVQKKKAKVEDKQRVYSELLAISNARGYSPGWTAHKYKTYFGVWPRGLREVAAEPSPEILSWVKSQQIRYAKSKEAKHAA